jgi:hypothetical protein
MNYDRSRHAAEAYITARETIARSGFSAEIDWQESREFANLSEAEFLAEAAWTILSAGFRESIVRTLFPRISAAFLRLENVRTLSRNEELPAR